MKRLLSLVLALALTLSLGTVGFTANAEGEKIKVACIGDSITQGYGSDIFDEDSYPAQLQLMLGDGYEVTNFGLGGRAAGKNTPMPYWNEPEYPASLEYQPDIVIIMMGTNDACTAYQGTIGTYKQDMTDLVKSYMQLESNPEVYIATAPKCGDEQVRADNVENIIIPAQLEIAEELGLEVIHMYEASCEFYDCFPDKLHPNNTGYALMAQLFYTEIFDGTLYDFTVKAYQGNRVQVYRGESTDVSAHQNYVIGNGNELTFKLYEGTHTIAISKTGYDDIVQTYTIPADTVADFSDVEYQENLAYNATAFDQGGRGYYGGTNIVENVNDGDMVTPWQLDSADFNGVYIALDFGKPTAFNRIEMYYEEGTRATDYTIEYSDDSVTWTPITYTEAPDTTLAHQTAKFDTVTARYVRIDIDSNASVGGKAFATSFYEFEVYADGDVTQPPVEQKKGDVNGDGVINSTDFMQVRRHFLKLYTIPEDKQAYADVNGDGTINSTDFMQIRRHFLKLYTIV